MPAPKKLTIGVSVNLQRYENLRLTVEGEVETEEDAEDLALYLDHVLARFGRNDPETASQIDRYRERVMPVTASPGGEAQEAAPVAPSETPVGPGPVAAPGFLSRRAGGAEGVAASGPAQESGIPEHPAPAAGDHGRCEECGAPLSRQEAKLSHLFVDRLLCKKCLDTLQG
ncbi:hypothetical protein AZH53_01125 [Methanomicrobiaceae archaeon CYW5]|nr:hypothetical protein [Methanovulcanius yangii]